MKFLLTGDWHLDEKKPKNRKEGFVQEQKDKIVWIFDLAEKENVEAILQPGDFCNSHKLSDRFKSFWIDYLERSCIPVITIPGQHDLKYHSSDILDTPMGVLWSAGSVLVADDIIPLPGTEDEKVHIYGAGWEQPIPEDPPKNKSNILLIHKMVSLKALWPGHQFVTPAWLLNNYDYDLFVCGDNHHGFYVEKNKRYVVNCGSLMRSKIDQKEHKPSVFIYDTETKFLEVHLIPVKPFSEVMNLQEAEKEKERNEELENFVKGLSDTNVEGLDFKKNLIVHLNKNKGKIGQGVIDIINEIVG